MDNLFLILAIVSSFALPIFILLAIVNFAKKDSQKAKKMLKNSGISFAVMIVAFIAFGVTTDSTSTTKNEKKVETVADTETPEEKAAREEKEAEEKALAEQKAKEEAEAKAKAKEESIPREYKSALIKAKMYAETMYMSKAGIYDQLVSEYGEGFPKEAAQYAIDNIEHNWKENALRKAKTYAEQMAMSDSAIYDQLISEYGEKFTPEEAKYAIDNLE